MNSTGISRHEHRNARASVRSTRTVRRTARFGFALPEKELILRPTRQPDTAGARARRHAPPRGASTPPSRRGSLPGARRRTAAARPPAPDTVPNPAPRPGVQTHQAAPGRGAAPAAGAGGGGGGSWRRRRRGKREKGERSEISWFSGESALGIFRGLVVPFLASGLLD